MMDPHVGPEWLNMSVVTSHGDNFGFMCKGFEISVSETCATAIVQ